MYAGLIIVLSTIQNKLFKEKLIETIKTIDHVKICLVCNNDSDKVYEIHSEITERCNNTDIVNIRSKRSINTSIRAGARFLNNKYNLKCIGFINQLEEFGVSGMLPSGQLILKNVKTILIIF